MRTDILMLAGIFFALTQLSLTKASATRAFATGTDSVITDTLRKAAAMKDSSSAAASSDSTLEMYIINQFDFDNHKLNKFNRDLIDKFIIPRCKPNSNIQIFGHNDIIGLYEHNKHLSCKRAGVVYDYIKKKTNGSFAIMEIICMGEDNPLYNNDTSEGRFFNRTVKIIIRTPLKE